MSRFKSGPDCLDEGVQIWFWKMSGPDKIQIRIWILSGQIVIFIFENVQTKTRYESGFCLDVFSLFIKTLAVAEISYPR